MSPAGVLPAASLSRRLRVRDALLSTVRSFFRARGYTEVETPLRVLSPGIDVHIDAIPAGDGAFLATSPELEMKKILSPELPRIFQLTRSFRREERGRLHHEEFTILEWYALDEDYRALMDTTEALVREAAGALCSLGVRRETGEWPRPFTRLSVEDAFRRWAGWSPSLEFDADRFFRDLVDLVEPRLRDEGAVFLHDYPEPAGALARRKAGAPALCERAELYLDGVEICNGYSELTDPVEQRRRFERDNRERHRLGKTPYPVDEEFLAALESGLPPCAGNALGVDRLCLVLSGAASLAEVTLLSARKRTE